MEHQFLQQIVFRHFPSESVIKMRRKLQKNTKGMSVVISTIIIVAVSITMAIAVSFWAMGIGSSLTKFEKLEFVSVYVDGPQNLGAIGAGSGATAAITSISPNGGITGILVINSGLGYTSGATVSITSGSGVGTLLQAITDVNGAITGININSAGSGYTVADTVTISPRVIVTSNYLIYLQIKNSGSAATSINNVFINGKPYDADSVNAPTPRNLLGVSLPVGYKLGARNGPGGQSIVYLPSGQTWNSGDYVEIELQTVAGRVYSTTVVLP
jgi:hypothetical protein